MKNYIFTSRSQHILNVIWQGRKFKVKFSPTYLGETARFSTTDEELAEAVKETQPYKAGVIKLTVDEIDEPKAEAAKEPEKKTEKPLWMQQGMKVAQSTEQTDAPAEAEQPQPQQTEQQTEQLFKMSINDVENYMDVKAYLRDTLGVDADTIKNKEQVLAYCKANGIVFPNYDLH